MWRKHTELNKKNLQLSGRQTARQNKTRNGAKNPIHNLFPATRLGRLTFAAHVALFDFLSSAVANSNFEITGRASDSANIRRSLSGIGAMLRGGAAALASPCELEVAVIVQLRGPLRGVSFVFSFCSSLWTWNEWYSSMNSNTLIGVLACSQTDRPSQSATQTLTGATSLLLCFWFLFYRNT